MRHRELTIIVLAALAALRVLYIIYAPFDVSPDEAHYWEWSRRLGLSYYSKGPLVAYVIAFFTGIFGDSAFGIRIGAVVFSAIGSYVVYMLGRDLFGSSKTGFYAAVLLNITPIFAIGSTLMTTDVLFIFFWALSVWCAHKAIEEKKGLWWYMTGLAVGVGFLAKYTMALYAPCLILFLLLSRQEKYWFKRPEPYIGGLISLVAVTPVIIWNIRHGQVTIRHTMGQAHMGSSALSMAGPFDFLLTQTGLLTPLIFIGLAYGLVRCAQVGFKEKKSGLILAFFTGAPLFLFFLFKSLHGKVQGNWAVASYITAFPAFVWAYSGLFNGSRGRRALKALAGAGIFMGLIVTLAAYFPWTLGPFGFRLIKGPPYNRVTGWEELGGRVSQVKEEMEKKGNVFIASDTYQITSELALYTKGNPVTYNIDAGTRRMNQYDLWPGYEGFTGYNAVYVKGGITEADKAVSDAFDRCVREVYAISWDDRPLKEFSIFRCYNFKGMKKPEVSSY